MNKEQKKFAEWLTIFAQTDLNEIVEDLKTELFFDMLTIKLSPISKNTTRHIEYVSKYGLILYFLEKREAFEACTEIKDMFITLMVMGANQNKELIEFLLAQSISIYYKNKVTQI